MSRSAEAERKPYNPYHLAGGYAAETLPDKKTAAVFARLCAHTDFMGGSVSIGIKAMMKETKYSERAIKYALATLTAMGRISRHQRGIGGKRGGRQTSITTVRCTEAELRRAGATDENYFGRGGSAGLFKVQNAAIQGAKRAHSKCKSDVFKGQRDAQEPLRTEPFLPEPCQEPLLQSKSNGNPKDFPATKKEGKTKAKTAGKDSLPETTPTAVVRAAARVTPAAAPLKPEVRSLLEAWGAPRQLFASLVGYTKIVDVLNGDTAGGCSNPIQAYVTIASANPKFKKIWMPTVGHRAGESAEYGGLPDAEAKQLVDAYNAMSPDQRERQAAELWWCGLKVEARKAFHIRYTEDRDGELTPNAGDVLAAWRLFSASVPQQCGGTAAALPPKPRVAGGVDPEFA